MIDLYIMYMDICVADHLARTGMFVYQTGKLWFACIGRATASSTNESFTSVGITTYSQSLILTLDIDNRGIHILDRVHLLHWQLWFTASVGFICGY